ncbi:hypothetical protein C8Q72DRAFT_794244 [Fomitopsis betulina]|nr:hypothetical protein C8Q72DRAFT_794244 [Fomitopsis betulina]
MSKNNSRHVAPATTGSGIQSDEVINRDHTGSVDHPGRPINYEAETASTMQQLESDAQSSPFPWISKEALQERMNALGVVLPAKIDPRAYTSWMCGWIVYDEAALRYLRARPDATCCLSLPEMWDTAERCLGGDVENMKKTYAEMTDDYVNTHKKLLCRWVDIDIHDYWKKHVRFPLSIFVPQDAVPATVFLLWDDESEEHHISFYCSLMDLDKELSALDQDLQEAGVAKLGWHYGSRVI